MTRSVHSEDDLIGFRKCLPSDHQIGYTAYCSGLCHVEYNILQKTVPCRVQHTAADCVWRIVHSILQKSVPGEDCSLIEAWTLSRTYGSGEWAKPTNPIHLTDLTCAS